MAIINGVGRIGIRSYVASQQITTSTLLNSLYSVWNADTLGTSLDTSIFGAWNAEASNNITVKNAWNANGNAIDSKSGANGTIAQASGTSFVTGTMSFSTSKIGSGAFTFNGSNFVSLPANTFTFVDDFTISAWIYVPSGYAGSHIISAFDNKYTYTQYRGWSISVNSTQLSFYIYGAAYSTNLYGISINYSNYNQWSHIVVVRKRGQQGKIYVNGVLQTISTVDARGTYTEASDIIYDSNHISYLGASFFAFSQPYYTMAPSGLKIDSLCTFETNLDQTAVSELYNSGNGQEYPFTLSNALIGTPKDVVGTNHGTSPSGSAPTFTTGKIGKAFLFDGVNDYVALPNNSLNFTGDFSFSLWMNRKAAVNANILSNYYNGATPYGWWLSISNGTIQFRMGNGTSTLLCNITTVLLGANVWQLITITKNGTSVKMYVDGLLKTSATITGNVVYTTTHYPMIGASKYDAGAPVGYLESGCLIDGVTTWQKELTSDEVTQLYNLSTGAQYPFSSQTLPSTMNQLGIDNATLMNGCTFTDGKIGKAFTFDGVNDFVQLPNNSLNFTGDFTISTWVYMTSGGPQTILSNEYYSGTTLKGFGIYIDNAGGQTTRFLQFAVYRNTTSDYTIYQTTTGLSNNAWSHISIVRKSGVDTIIYVNGEKVNTTLVGASSSRTLDPLYNTTQYVTIGADVWNSTGTQFGNYMKNGSKIDGLSVWQKELTQAEVTELYNSGNGKQITTTPIVQSGLVLNLDASRTSSYTGTGTTWTDISGNSNNGTLTNGPVFGTASGGAITFDGVNDYVQMSNALTLGTNQFTIEFWINNKYNYTSGNLKNTILSNYLDYASSWNTYLYIGIYYGTNGGDFGSFNTNGDIYLINSVGNFIMNSSNTGKINITNNQWTHVCFVRNGNDVSTYKNGIKLATINNVSTANNNYSGSRSFKIGGGVSNAQNHFGDLSNNRIYNTALTDAEVLQNFNATKSRFGL